MANLGFLAGEVLARQILDHQNGNRCHPEVEGGLQARMADTYPMVLIHNNGSIEAELLDGSRHGFDSIIVLSGIAFVGLEFGDIKGREELYPLR